MFVYSTCRDCGGLLHVTNNETVHPSCTPKPTRLETLNTAWRELAELAPPDQAEMDRLEDEIREYEIRPPRLLDAALRYAAWGWPVFPLKPLYKQPASRHGFKDGTTDPDEIRALWSKCPYNIGLPTGLAFDVIDIDVPDGAQTYARMLEADVIPDIHGQVATSSGGLHLYIHPLDGGNLARSLPGVDYRGTGGYVVAPPSTLGQPGRSWSWITPPSPTITGVGDCFGASI